MSIIFPLSCGRSEAVVSRKSVTELEFETDPPMSPRPQLDLRPSDEYWSLITGNQSHPKLTPDASLKAVLIIFHSCPPGSPPISDL